MQCPQCSAVLVEPNGSEKYCEGCGFPEENRQLFNLIEIKAYLRSMFKKQSCGDGIKVENQQLACAYNLLLEEHHGITDFCDQGKADDLTFEDFHNVDI